MIYTTTIQTQQDATPDLWDFLAPKRATTTLPFAQFKTVIVSTDTMIPPDNLKVINNPQRYTKFKIQKHSGGYREILAPDDELKKTQKELAHALQQHILPHNAAHAYTLGRSAKTAMLVHQHNQSRWFLKLDIKDFFPSLTPSVVIPALIQQSSVIQNTTPLYDIAKYAFYNNYLPQGAPTSPILSNLTLYEFDYVLTTTLPDLVENGVYTRYADDLTISAPNFFDYEKVTNRIDQLLRTYQLQLNYDKTKFQSSSGRNWTLGIMLNKDNNLTIGHVRKKKLKQNIYNLFKYYKNAITVKDNQEFYHAIAALNGELSYFHQIEPDYAAYVLTKYERQFNITFKQIRKEVL